MARSRKKRITIAPGVRLNVSIDAVGSSFGVRSKSISAGENRTYLNTGTPGTGIYSWQKNRGSYVGKTNLVNVPNDLSKSRKSGNGCIIFAIFLQLILIVVIEVGDIEIIDNPLLTVVAYFGTIILAIVGILISAIVDSIRRPLILAKEKKQLFPSQIAFAREALSQATDPTKREILKSYISCLELSQEAEEIEPIICALKNKIEKKSTPALEEQLRKYETESSTLSNKLAAVQLDTDKALNYQEKKAYALFCERFETLVSSEKTWIISFAKANTQSNSPAYSSVVRKDIGFYVGVFDFIKSKFDIPILTDYNGLTYYLYPHFIIKAISSTSFDVFPIESVEMKYELTRFIEDGIVPNDSKILSYTYQDVTKNGDRDNRYYSPDPQRPIVGYGSVNIHKFDLSYQISNAEVTEKFVEAYKVLQTKKNIKNMRIINESEKKSESYIDMVNSSVGKIVDFYDSLKNDSSFQSLMETTVKPNFVLEGIPITKLSEQIRTLFLADIIKCYEELGHFIDFNKKEGFGLLLFVYRTIDIYFDYRTIYPVSDKIKKSMEILVNDIKENTRYINLSKNKFIISELLGEYNAEQQKKYFALLYEFASNMTKADDYVSDVESRWLEELLHLSGSNTPTEAANLATTPDHKKPEAIRSQVEPAKRTVHVPKASPHEELQSLIGLDSVKSEITTLVNYVKIQQARESKGLKSSQLSYHCIFTGNPGTGKTTVARIVAKIYRNLGIIKKGHLIETDRSGLVAEYVGQTAVKTNKIIDSALDGVLFIDEAYSLIANGGNDYGKEAIATLLKRMEDNRDRLVVILAGYTNEMEVFINSNPGLQSRFNRYIDFADYSGEELYRIFELNLKKFEYTISDEAEVLLKGHLMSVVREKDPNFGNARFVRNLFEKTLERQANRLAVETNFTTEKLSEICKEDMCFEQTTNNRDFPDSSLDKQDASLSETQIT